MLILSKLIIAQSLCYAFIPALVFLSNSSVMAQSGSRNPHSYCKSKARELTDNHFKGSNIASARNNAAIGAVLGRSVGNTGTGVGLGAAFGSTSNRKEKKEYYQREYDSCIRSNSN